MSNTPTPPAPLLAACGTLMQRRWSSNTIRPAGSLGGILALRCSISLPFRRLPDTSLAPDLRDGEKKNYLIATSLVASHSMHPRPFPTTPYCHPN